MANQVCFRVGDFVFSALVLVQAVGEVVGRGRKLNPCLGIAGIYVSVVCVNNVLVDTGARSLHFVRIRGAPFALVADDMVCFCNGNDGILFLGRA